jgi:hypothetical protein
MHWTELLTDLALLLTPPLSCVWAWWLWAQRRERKDRAPEWSRVATVIDLVVFTLSIGLGAFALLYWRDFSGAPVPPEATRISTMLGFALAVFGLPFSVMAKSWNRVALVLCSLALLGFYVGMIAAI